VQAPEAGAYKVSSARHLSDAKTGARARSARPEGRMVRPQLLAGVDAPGTSSGLCRPAAKRPVPLQTARGCRCGVQLPGQGRPCKTRQRRFFLMGRPAQRNPSALSRCHRRAQPQASCSPIWLCSRRKKLLCPGPPSAKAPPKLLPKHEAKAEARALQAGRQGPGPSPGCR